MSRQSRHAIPSFIILAVLGVVVIVAVFSPTWGERRHPAVDTFGAELATLGPTEARALGVAWPSNGVVVDGVVAGCLACRSGLMPDDIVVAVNGQPVVDRMQFWTLLSAQPGPTVTLDVVRRGARQQISLPWDAEPNRLGASVASPGAPHNPCAVCPL
jgi:S1-C subfamily serine protease